MDILDFTFMGDNYEERVLARFEAENREFVVDTAAVTDSDDPYETAVSHLEYDEGRWIVVETYASKDKALVGHEDWVQRMTTEPLPEALRDCSNCILGKFIDILVDPGEDWRLFPRIRLVDDQEDITEGN